MTKSKLIILTCLISLPIGLLFGIIISNWGWLGQSFFQVRFVEILHLVVTFMIALFITYLVNTKLNYDIKKKEMLIDLLAKFQSNLTELLELGYDYINTPDKNKQGKIVSGFKKLSLSLGLILDINKSSGYFKKDEDPFSQGFLKFKESLTDTPFGQKTPKFSEDKIKQIEESYSSLLKRLYECKLKLYS